jgi:hypothetical protein
MEFAITRRVQADATTVWAALVDVERWPEWTDSMSSVRRLDGDGPFSVGDRVRVKQPRLTAAVWKVTELTDQASFTWRSRGPGLRTPAGHT